MQLPGDSSLPLPGIARANAAFGKVVVQLLLPWKILRPPPPNESLGVAAWILSLLSAHEIRSKEKRCLTSNRCSSRCVVHIYICLPSASPLSSESFQAWVLWLRGRIVRVYIWATLLKEHRLLVSNLSFSFRLFWKQSWKNHHPFVFALLLSWGQNSVTALKLTHGRQMKSAPQITWSIQEKKTGPWRTFSLSVWLFNYTILFIAKEVITSGCVYPQVVLWTICWWVNMNHVLLNFHTLKTPLLSICWESPWRTVTNSNHLWAWPTGW